jgi:hypothetical protein
LANIAQDAKYRPIDINLPNILKITQYSKNRPIWSPCLGGTHPFRHFETDPKRFDSSSSEAGRVREKQKFLVRTFFPEFG